MKTTIYAVYHREQPRIASDVVVPIHAGRAVAGVPLAGMIGDDSGIEISSRNASWCELTALYWAWKNDTTSDYIGLMHYRRVLDFCGPGHSRRVEEFASRFDIAQWGARADEWLTHNLLHYDIIVPRAHQPATSIEKNITTLLPMAEWQAMRRIMAEAAPDYLADFEAVSAGRALRLGNLMVMRRSCLDDYCSWLFPLLFRLEQAKVDRSNYSRTQRRHIGHVAERLTEVYLRHLTRRQPDLAIHEVGITNLSHAMIVPYVDQTHWNNPEWVNIAFAADRAYLPHAAAMVRSLLENADRSRCINLFFLHDAIDARDLELFAEIITLHPGARLHPINIAGTLGAYYRSPSRAPSNITYSTFLLFQLLPALDRVLHVDADMIFLGDVCDIFDTPMGNARLAAVIDHVMTRVLAGTTPTRAPQVDDLYEYLRGLGLDDAQIRRYFNAGLILFNFAAMDVCATGRALQRMAETGCYMFRDQDILNVHFRDETLRLPARFNVPNTLSQGFQRVPADIHNDAEKARANPLAIHYADRHYKPWAASVPLGHRYWQALLHTPFFGEVVHSYARASGRARRFELPPGTHRGLSGRLVAPGRRLARRWPVLDAPLRAIYRMMRQRGA